MMSDSLQTDPAGQDVQVDPFFGGFVLETLTIGLYGEARSAIREYLQNGLDAVLQATDHGLVSKADAQITITLQDNALVIRDNGIGLSSEVAVPTLSSIGASAKDYREQAGFRGIGRLAGIAFCNSLIFRTKAKGERFVTKVRFDAKQLRADMSPASGGRLSLLQLLAKNVKASRHPTRHIDRHFFEVTMEDLVNPPSESTDVDQMVDFVGQVAPVSYHRDFLFKSQIEAAATARHFGQWSRKVDRVSGLEQVRIVVKRGDREVEVAKPYHGTFTVGRDAVALNDILIYDPPSKRWWGWIGKKLEPGAYKDEATKAIRVRLRNIQIGGTQLMGDLFSSVEDATSYGRFNDWYVGEIFVDPTFVIPNSRRDGFEDNSDWETFRSELLVLCRDLGKEAYQISKDAQHTVAALGADYKKIELAARTLIAAQTPNADKLIAVSSDVTKLQRKVSRAFRYADLETASQLRGIENKLLDVKTRAVRKLGVAQSLDLGQVREQAQREVMRDLMRAFRERLDPATLSKVSGIVATVMGTTDFT